jgi:hypothetical protein
MRVFFLTAVILGILLLPLYAQAPEPVEADTMGAVSEPDTVKEVEEPAKAAEPEKAAEPAKPAAMAAELSVSDMTFCAGVENREPVSSDSTFSADIGKIYCWSNIKNDGGEASVEHVWYYNGAEMGRVELPANFPRNRVWSSKTILPEWKGEWKVAIMSGAEKLGEMACTVE